MSAPALHMAWAQLLLRSAHLAGARDVVVSPGSRSTPLALAAHRSAELRSHFIVDERSAAFFALGQARVTGRPTLLVCTSGTAAAHHYPAVIEASMSGLPMVIVTADRPWELLHCGAAQTIDQARLFGAFARRSFALGAPEPHEGALRGLARAAAQAVAASLGPEPGPVHVNAPFRKPLEPAHADDGAPWIPLWRSLMEGGAARAIEPRAALDEAALDEVARLVSEAERGLIVCGPSPAHGDVAAHRREVAALATATGFPLLPEATSQLRFGVAAASVPSEPREPIVMSWSDALLRSPSFRRRFAPDMILEIGAPPTSAGYAQLLAEHPGCPRVVCCPLGWQDPSGTARWIVRAEAAAFCGALRARLSGTSADDAKKERRRAWVQGLLLEEARARLARNAVSREHLTRRGVPLAGQLDVLAESVVAKCVMGACPPDTVLMLGNSSPVRDMDTWCASSERPLFVLHQRGASGIDGLVSGAAGAQSASGGAVSLLLGDLSFLHDLGGLAVARRAEGPLVITVVNNGGGRIFEQLPIHRALGSGEAFERCFATPEPVDLAAAAAAFGVPFERAETKSALDRALAAAHTRKGVTLIEAVVLPHDGAERNRALWARIESHFQSRKDDDR